MFNKTALRHYKLSLEADDWCIPSKEPLDLAVYRAAKWFSHDLTWLLTQTLKSIPLKVLQKHDMVGPELLAQRWTKAEVTKSGQGDQREGTAWIVKELPWYELPSSSCFSLCFLYMCDIHRGRREQNWHSGSRWRMVKDAVIESQKERESDGEVSWTDTRAGCFEDNLYFVWAVLGFRNTFHPNVSNPLCWFLLIKVF